MTIEVVCTAESTATGGGRDGHVKSDDGRVDLETSPPTAMGGNGGGTNPEQLFAAGYAACFLGALRLVGGKSEVVLDDVTTLRARIGFGKDSAGGFGLTAKIVSYLPGVEQGIADGLVQQAHQVCPYSKATRGDIDVDVSAKV
ncbi:organic hydroperoxide resistance protein [Mycobacterium basiliense]|nr:organic hydroperoxide resistance protein [Mycobacterium basiliense]